MQADDRVKTDAPSLLKILKGKTNLIQRGWLGTWRENRIGFVGPPVRFSLPCFSLVRLSGASVSHPLVTL